MLQLLMRRLGGVADSGFETDRHTDTQLHGRTSDISVVPLRLRRVTKVFKAFGRRFDDDDDLTRSVDHWCLS